MSCGIEGMKSWNWFDEICARIYAYWISTKWHMDYLVEETKRKQLIAQWEEFKYDNGEEE